MKTNKQVSAPQKSEHENSFQYIPITDIIKSKKRSKPSIYNDVKEGKYSLYKFGRRSFVKISEFEAAFHKVTINK